MRTGDAKLALLQLQVQELISKLKRVEFVHVMRGFNVAADFITTEAKESGKIVTEVPEGKLPYLLQSNTLPECLYGEKELLEIQCRQREARECLASIVAMIMTITSNATVDSGSSSQNIRT